MELETSTTTSPTPPYSPPEERVDHRPSSRERRLFSPRLLVESLLIVFSVLLGFSANEWHDRSVDRALAEQAMEGFRHEIASNLALLDGVQPKHALMAARLDSIAARARPGGTAGGAARLARELRSDAPRADTPSLSIALQRALGSGAVPGGRVSRIAGAPRSDALSGVSARCSGLELPEMMVDVLGLHATVELPRDLAEQWRLRPRGIHRLPGEFLDQR